MEDERKTRKVRKRRDVMTASEIDRVIDEECSEGSLFSSDGASEYVPGSDRGSSSDGENLDPINFNLDLGLMPHGPLADDLLDQYVEVNDEVGDLDNIANDPNVLFVVSDIHKDYQAQQNSLTDKNNDPNVNNDSDNESHNESDSDGESRMSPDDEGSSSDGGEHVDPINVWFDLGINPNSPLVDDVEVEFDQIYQEVVDLENIANDPNVLFVVSNVHDDYQRQQRVWTDTNNDPQVHNFTGKEEVFIQSTDPVETFNNFVDEELLNKIVGWINNRALNVQGAPTSRHSNMRWWKPVNLEELKKFLGLCMLMGNLHFPSMKHCWSTSEIYEHPIFGKTMSRNRFEAILRCLCFYDAEVDSTDDKLHKINNVLKPLLGNFSKAYTPGKNLSLDEAMVLWRGRLSFRQYIKNKRHKYGIKLYELCTPDGYILNIMIYTGKGTIIDPVKGHTFEVVTRLMQDYLGKGHALFLDNFYSSVDLYEHLMINQTNACGTLQSNRAGNPQTVVAAKLKKGECISRQKGHVTVMKWKDKRYVLTISTTHGPGTEEVSNRRGQIVTKPSMVVAYNKNMSGIDRSDQMISYYSTPRKSLRWYIKIFFHLMDAALWNSTYILCKNLGRKVTYLEFRESMITHYLQVQPTPRRPVRPKRDQDHNLVKGDKRIRCRQCFKTQKKRKATAYYCVACTDLKGDQIGLCAAPCFADWHQE